MIKPETAVALSMSMFHEMDLECPTCEQPVEYGSYHRKCLQERCGGEIPEDIERLIEAFEFKDTGEQE